MRPRRLRGISRGFPRLSPCGGQVPYVLLTRAPVAGGRVAAPPLPLDLHVLGLSLAFILSQDQTLRCLFFYLLFSFCSFDSPGARLAAVTPGVVLSRVSRSICLYPGRRPRRPVVCSIISMYYPRPSRPACKVNDYPPFFQTPAAFFSAARASFPVCGCKGTTVPRSFPNFQAIFFHLFSHPPRKTLSLTPMHLKLFSRKTALKHVPR